MDIAYMAYSEEAAREEMQTDLDNLVKTCICGDKPKVTLTHMRKDEEGCMPGEARYFFYVDVKCVNKGCPMSFPTIRSTSFQIWQKFMSRLKDG